MSREVLAGVGTSFFIPKTSVYFSIIMITRNLYLYLNNHCPSSLDLPRTRGMQALWRTRGILSLLNCICHSIVRRLCTFQDFDPL